jgi:hypothetical protein
MTLENMLFEMWGKSVWSAEVFDTIPETAVQVLIGQTRSLMLKHGWTQAQICSFFRFLREDLERRTRNHPTTLMIIRLLKLETEAN